MLGCLRPARRARPAIHPPGCAWAEPAKPDGTLCNDGINCTTADKCTAGACGGTAVVCPAPADACHLQGTCQEATGTCNNPVAPDGTGCSDGNACTQTDICSSGTCTGGNPVGCSGPTACKEGSTCDPSSGMCVGGPDKPNGTSCDDGKACTTTDVCTTGVCGGTQVTCPPPSNSCQIAGSCQEPSGTCSPPVPAPDGSQCSDGNLCTSTDVCTSGTCGGQPVTCTGRQSCDPADGQCKLDACGQCLEDAISFELCDVRIGCSNIQSGPGDRQVCDALQACILATHCAVV